MFRLDPKQAVLDHVARKTAAGPGELGPEAQAIRNARGLARTGQVDKALSLYRELNAREPLTGDLALEYWQLVGRTPGGYDRAIVTRR